jgi:hypothetical protein
MARRRIGSLALVASVGIVGDDQVGGRRDETNGLHVGPRAPFVRRQVVTRPDDSLPTAPQLTQESLERKDIDERRYPLQRRTQARAAPETADQSSPALASNDPLGPVEVDGVELRMMIVHPDSRRLERSGRQDSGLGKRLVEESHVGIKRVGGLAAHDPKPHAGAGVTSRRHSAARPFAMKLVLAFRP